MLDGKIVTMITNLCNKYGTETIGKALERIIESDDGEPSTWAKPEVDEAKELGLTDGSRPQVIATRQEVMMMCLRTYKKLKEEK